MIVCCEAWHWDRLITAIHIMALIQQQSIESLSTRRNARAFAGHWLFSAYVCLAWYTCVVI
jgi:hypothetical protein